MKKLAVALAFLIVLLVSCNDPGDMVENEVLWADIYYRSETETIGSEPFAIEISDNLKKMTTDAIEQMREDPVAKELTPALPRDTKVIKFSIKDGCASLELSEEYLALSVIDKTIANTCIFKTISNFIRIKELDVVVNGIIQAAEFNKDLTEFKEPQVYTGADEVELYLYNRSGELVKTKINIERKNGVLPEKAALEMLCTGNASYTSPLPQNCKVNSVKVSAGLCSIDFSQELLSCPENLAEEMVKAIVLTQTSIDYIDRVKITVNGKYERGFNKISLNREYERENFVKDE